jgi:hypothetical protein
METLLLGISKLLMMKELRAKELLFEAMELLSSSIRKFLCIQKLKKVSGFMAAL